VYRALDIVVNASTRPEPFGRTVAEALAAGRTVVAPSAGGILEQISDGETGRLYPAGDATALASILGSLVASPEERRRLGAAAARHALSHLDAARLGPEVLGVYETSRHRRSSLRGAE
jgi:glycosyltransferase involved in cell wall biosynthesis